MRRRANDDCGARARAARYRQCGDAHRPGTLHHHSVLPANASAFNAMNSSNQGAARPDHCFGRQVIGDVEDIRAGSQVMEFRVTAQEMRRLVAAINDPVGAPLRATSWQPFFGAIVTLYTGSGGVPGDAIAETQRLAGPIT